VNVLGVPVVEFDSCAHALACAEDAIESRRKSFWVAINPQKVYRALQDPRLLSILSQADVGICDGVGVSLAAKLLCGRALRRCTGCDLFFALIARAAETGWKVFFLGASPDSNAQACQALLKRYPRLRVVGRQDGSFSDSTQVVRQINDSGADLLFVGMGSPGQEFWIGENLGRLNARFAMGVGGSFDVASGRAMRAPKIFRRTGTEFLFQLMMEPSRFRRQVVYLPFVLRVLQTKLLGSPVSGGAGGA